MSQVYVFFFVLLSLVLLLDPLVKPQYFQWLYESTAALFHDQYNRR